MNVNLKNLMLPCYVLTRFVFSKTTVDCVKNIAQDAIKLATFPWSLGTYVGLAIKDCLEIDYKDFKKVVLIQLPDSQYEYCSPYAIRVLA